MSSTVRADRRSLLRLSGVMIALPFLAIAAFFLITEHRAHLYGLLPYLLFLACPLMHLFMHHGHGNHQEHRGSHVEADAREEHDHAA